MLLQSHIVDRPANHSGAARGTKFVWPHQNPRKLAPGVGQTPGNAICTARR
jgi:hypothetical protein